MNQPNAIPEEDRYLKTCIHEWMDLYGGQGTHRRNPDLALAAFFCKKCLLIRVKTWDQSQYRLSPEFLKELEEDEE